MLKTERLGDVFGSSAEAYASDGEEKAAHTTDAIKYLADPTAASTPPINFAHIENVCVKLMQKGNNDEAVKYLDKMRTLIDTICEKLVLKNKARTVAPRWGG